MRRRPDETPFERDLLMVRLDVTTVNALPEKPPF
jgi:hypothetical protein